MNATIQYSLLRILIFLASLMLLWLAGLRNPLLLLLVAAAVSLLLSLFLLSGLRRRMSAEVVDRVERRQTRRAERPTVQGRDEQAEDARLDRRAATASTDTSAAEDPDAFR